MANNILLAITCKIIYFQYFVTSLCKSSTRNDVVIYERSRPQGWGSAVVSGMLQ